MPFETPTTAKPPDYLIGVSILHQDCLFYFIFRLQTNVFTANDLLKAGADFHDRFTLPGPSVELQMIPQFMSLVHRSLQKFTVAPRTDSTVIDRSPSGNPKKNNSRLPTSRGSVSFNGGQYPKDVVGKLAANYARTWDTNSKSLPSNHYQVQKCWLEETDDYSLSWG